MNWLCVSWLEEPWALPVFQIPRDGGSNPIAQLNFSLHANISIGLKKLLFVRLAPAGVPDLPEPKGAVAGLVFFGLVYWYSGLSSDCSCRFKNQLQSR